MKPPSEASPGSLRDLQLRVGEMDCPSCLSKIEGHLSGVEGVRSVRGSVLSRTLTVTVDEGYLQEADVRSEVERLGYAAEPLVEGQREGPFANTWATSQAHRVYVAVALAALGALVHIATRDPDLFAVRLYGVRGSDLVFVLAALVGGWNFFPKGLAAATRLALDMNFLMSVAIVGALLLGEFVEAAAIAVLFSIAELLEAYSVDRAGCAASSCTEPATTSVSTCTTSGPVGRWSLAR